MKTLHLNLKKKWFDMILSGEKKEEYRDITEYWAKRFHKRDCYYTDTFRPLNNNPNMLKDFDTVTFSNGYAKDRRQVEVIFKHFGIHEGKPEWGAEKGKEYFVLHLGDIVRSNCSNKTANSLAKFTQPCDRFSANGTELLRRGLIQLYRQAQFDIENLYKLSEKGKSWLRVYDELKNAGKTNDIEASADALAEYTLKYGRDADLAEMYIDETYRQIDALSAAAV